MGYGMDLTEAEDIKKRWKEYTEELYKKDLFIIRDLNAKVGSQEIPGVIGKFGLGIQNEAGKRLTVLLRKHTGQNKCLFPTTQETTLHMNITRWPILKSD